VSTVVAGGLVGGLVDGQLTVDVHLHSQISRLSVFTVFFFFPGVEWVDEIEPWGFEGNLTHLRVVVKGIFAPFFLVQCDFFYWHCHLSHWVAVLEKGRLLFYLFI